MIVSIDTTSPIPVYQQLRSQLRRLIASGRLPTGSRLPTIRQLANDLGIASATVSRVYELLASDGWVTGAGRHGTIVVGEPRRSDVAVELEDEAEQLATAASQLGMSEQQVVGLVTKAFRRVRAQPT